MNLHEKTSYALIQTQKAIEIIPTFIKCGNKDGKTAQKQLLCKFQENDVLKEEIIPFEQICIIPVSKKDSRNNCIEKGIFSRIKLDQNFNVISREGEIPSTKVYVDDETFHLIISSFSSKIN